jgi:hypothetical protein
MMHSSQPIEIGIIYGILRIVVAVSLGTAFASVLQYKGWIKYFSFIVKPFFKFGKLPSICGTAFLTALLSNQAAAAMIADARREGKITRKEMISGGIINSFPAHMSHLSRTFFVIIPLLGSIAVVYIIISFLIALIRTIIVLIFTRKTAHPDFKDFTYIETKKVNLTWSEIWTKTLKRILRVLKRVLYVYAPLYIIMTYASHAGFFKILSNYVPNTMKHILSPEIFAIIFSKLGGLTASASVAMGMLQTNQITGLQILFALLLGNLLTIPFNTVRRNLPIALGIYPGKDGFWVAITLGVLRFIINFIVVLILFFIITFNIQG